MNQEHRNDKRTDGASPLAWELLVRDDRTDWNRYNIHETERSAQKALERVSGEPLQVRIRPLYALEWVSVHERRPSSDEVYWHCDYLTDASDTAVLSGLAYWMAAPMPELAEELPG